MNTGPLTGFFQDLFTVVRAIGIPIAILMAGWAGILIMTGRRDGTEKLVLAAIGLFVLLMSPTLIGLVQAATR